MGRMTDEDRKRLTGPWERARVIGGVNGYPKLAVGFNDDEDLMAVMASIGRISKWWADTHVN